MTHIFRPNHKIHWLIVISGVEHFCHLNKISTHPSLLSRRRFRVWALRLRASSHLSAQTTRSVPCLPSYWSMWRICFPLLLLCTNNVCFFTLSCCINSQYNLDWQLNISMHNNINVYQYSLIFCILTDHYNTLKVQFIDWHCSCNSVHGPVGCLVCFLQHFVHWNTQTIIVNWSTKSL